MNENPTENPMESTFGNPIGNQSETPIEDVLIGGGNNKKSKGGKWIKIAILILFLLLIAIGVLYWYILYYKSSETPKTLFLKHVANSNIEYLSNNELYREILNKYKTKSFEATTSMNFSTTMKTLFSDNDSDMQGLVEEETDEEEIDLSKFVVDLNTIRDIENSKSFNELGIKYSDNELLKVKLISTENAIAIASDEIVNKYIGVNKENAPELLKSKTGFDIDLSAVDLNDVDKIEMDSEYIDTKIGKFFEIISQEIPEERFTKQDNIVITRGTESITTSAYNLKLEQPEFNTVLEKILTELKNDTELLSKIASSEKNTQEQESFEMSNSPDLNAVNSIQDTDFEVSNNPDFNTVSEEEYLENDINYEYSSNSIIMSDILSAIILGRKLDITVEEIQDKLNSYIEEIQDMDGTGLNVTVYVSDNGTEKLSMIFPDEGTLDIEYSSKSETENTMKITYLNDEETNIYNENIEDYETKIQRNGFSVEIYKLQQSASTTFKIVFCNIENKEINQKMSANLVTTGTIGSKKYTNKLIIIFSNSEGETTATINNTIDFDSVSEIEELNNENCLFLDQLSEEELNDNLGAIMAKILEVYQQKMSNLNFINTNSHTSVVEQNPVPEDTENNEEISQPSISTDRETARQLIIQTVGSMMGEAQNNGQEFTLQNLNDLHIEGHTVSSIISSELAIINVDGYKFNLTAEFELTDAE